MLAFILFIGIAYCLGSINSAILISRIFTLPDPRSEGSKNPGATNMLRLSGMHYAVMVLGFDMLKGLLPVLLAKLLHASPVVIGFTCFAAVMGHMYPVFFQFRGGKGVATALGAVLGLHVILGALVILTWLVVLGIWGYSSLASIITIILMPFYAVFIVNHFEVFLPLCFITIFILFQHRQNITRLMDGKETKINLQRKDVPNLVENFIESEEMKEDNSKKDTAKKATPKEKAARKRKKSKDA